jgi:hypothetical protein
MSARQAVPAGAVRIAIGTCSGMLKGTPAHPGALALEAI